MIPGLAPWAFLPRPFGAYTLDWAVIRVVSVTLIKRPWGQCERRPAILVLIGVDES
jgi:hypothetical protein